MKRRSEGLCGPRAPAPGAKAPGPLWAILQVWQKRLLSPASPGGTESLWVSGPRKSGKNALGKASFSQGILPDFPRMLCIRVGVFDAGPEAITTPCQVYFLSTADVCFLVESSSFHLCGSRGIIPLVRSGLKAQRIPFACLPIVIIYPSYRCC